MASGHMNRVKRPDTWLHRPMLQNVKKILANSEPSTHVQVFGCRDGGTIHALQWPASEKRQGTKSRDVGGSSAAGAMGIWPRAQVRL